MTPFISKVLTRFDDEAKALLAGARFLFYGGGLGDVFHHINHFDCYRKLDTLGSDERAFVFISSHNSNAFELFAWHPRGANITVCNPGFFPNFVDQGWAKSIGLPADRCQHNCEKPRLTYHQPADEVSFTDEIVSGGKYIVFSLTASNLGRSIPRSVAVDACGRALAAGYKVVLVGRNYVLDIIGQVKRIVRDEIRLDLHDGVIDTIDRLSVPSVARIVHGAAGVLSCHSAICMLSWLVDRPTFLCCEPFAMDAYWPKNPGDPFEGYAFGGGRPLNQSVRHLDYKGNLFTQWLSNLK